MNCPVHLHFRLIHLFFLHDLFICNHYDNNIFFLSYFKQRFFLWLENLELIKILLKSQRIPCNVPAMHMSSEKLRVFFYQHSLVSIWSLQDWPSADPKQACAVCRLNSVPTVPEPGLSQKNAAAGIVKTSHSSRKPNCLNHFSKRHGKAKLCWSPKSAKPMKIKSAKKSRLPLSIACWHATGGSRPAEIIQRIRIECNCHKCCAQILCFRRCGPARSIRLGNAVSESSRFYSYRSYPFASGGAC
jgi:hypothetical protein